MQMVGVGIVGSGFMGLTYSEVVARHAAGCRLVAVAGGRRAPKLAEEYGVAAESSVDSLFARDDIQAVVLATPDLDRLNLTKKAAAERNKLQDLPECSRWLTRVEAAFNHRQPLNPADGETAEMAALIRGNVVAQLLNLREQPSVARALQEGRLAVHGWYYDILSGRIEQYDERTRRFAPLIG